MDNKARLELFKDYKLGNDPSAVRLTSKIVNSKEYRTEMLEAYPYDSQINDLIEALAIIDHIVLDPNDDGIPKEITIAIGKIEIISKLTLIQELSVTRNNPTMLTTSTINLISQILKLLNAIGEEVETIKVASSWDQQMYKAEALELLEDLTQALAMQCMIWENKDTIVQSEGLCSLFVSLQDLIIIHPNTPLTQSYFLLLLNLFRSNDYDL